MSEKANMHPSTPARRRWLRFSVRDILWASIVFALALAVLAEHQRAENLKEAFDVVDQRFRTEFESNKKLARELNKLIFEKMEARP